MQVITHIQISFQMKKKMLALISLALFAFTTVTAQDIERQQAVKQDSLFYQSVYNLRPVLINKHQMLVNFQLDFPRYYKVYNPKQNSLAKVPSVVVLNEFYFNTFFTYGISDKWNVYAVLPVVDVHHYSPMIFKSGIGFGDIQLGIDYQLLGKKSNRKDFLSLELKNTLPTGKYKNLSNTDYPTGLGSFRFMLALNGLHKFKALDLWYTAYYEYRTNHSGLSIGDETGFFITLQKSFPTSLGDFGIEGGLNSYYNFKDSNQGKEIPNSKDYTVNLYAGGWYKYLDKFYLRFGVPYAVYQNNSWMTKYQVMIQFDYLIN